LASRDGADDVAGEVKAVSVAGRRRREKIAFAYPIASSGGRITRLQR
jgi:hypothetical protein